MANGVIDFLKFDSPNLGGPVRTDIRGPDLRLGQQQTTGNGTPQVEHPGVGVYRQEQLRELLHRCSRICAAASSTSVGSVSDEGIRAVFYRWSLRAAHASSSHIDPVIPSWTYADELVEFFQRQFISESRKYADGSGVTNIEHLREVGRSVAETCLSAAKDVVRYQSKIESQWPRDWSDSSIGLSAAQSVDRYGGSSVYVSWQGQASVQVRSHTFSALEGRYCGPPQRLLASIFAAIKRYDTRRMLTVGTPFDKRLSQSCVSTIGRELSATVEGWSDPLSVTGDNKFCGLFPDVDRLFGGCLPFGKEGGGGEIPLLEKGGSVVVMPPVDNNTAALYFHSMVDMLDSAENQRPLSFAIIVPSECFHDFKAPPSASDLPSLDPRLGGRHSRYVRYVKTIPAGQHLYNCGAVEGVSNVSQTGSLFILLQNDVGTHQFPASDNAVLNIVFSTSPGYLRNDPSSVHRCSGQAVTQPLSQVSVTSSPSSQMGFSGFDSTCAPASPFMSSGSFGGGFSSMGFKNEQPKSRHRGRPFELQDYGTEVDAGNDVDVVSGMLNNLGVTMFGSNTASQDVDIEAISLLGISNKGGAKGMTSGLNPFG